MLHLQLKSKKTVFRSLQMTGAAAGRHASRLLPLALLLAFLSACAPGEAPPAAICDTYSRALFTTQLMGGADPAAVVGDRATGPMVGEVATSVHNGVVVTVTLDPAEQKFLYDHRIDGTPVLPGMMVTREAIQA